MKTTNNGTSKNCGTKNCGTKNAKNTKGASNCQNKSGSRSAEKQQVRHGVRLRPLRGIHGQSGRTGQIRKARTGCGRFVTKNSKQKAVVDNSTAAFCSGLIRITDNFCKCGVG